MPDTKSGREKKGRNKRAQLERRLARRDLRMNEVESDGKPPRAERIDSDSEFLAEPATLDDD